MPLKKMSLRLETSTTKTGYVQRLWTARCGPCGFKYETDPFAPALAWTRRHLSMHRTEANR